MFRYNPFKPNSIAGPAMFAGRGDEIKTLDQALFQIKHGNPWHFLIHGERGIGKSSLLFCIDLVAKGKIQAWYGTEPRFNFITVSIELAPGDSLSSIVTKIGSSFSRSLDERESIKSAAKGVWEFVTRWEVMGVKYASDDRPDSALIEDLTDSIARAMERLKGKVDGTLVLIDEADQAPVTAHLGEFIKIFTERMTKKQCDNVGVGVSGISPTVLQRLKRSHESSPRVLNHLLLEPLLMEERLEIIEKGIAEANEKSEHDTAISADAADWIARFSEGYPHFIQQYAYSAFETDTDFQIDIKDVHYGAFKENGALDQLGARYFEDMYLDQINSDEYRKVLKAMAEHPNEYIARKDMKEATGLRETTLTNALATLKKKHIILPHREKKGLYKLPTNSFAAWIRARVQREADRQKQDSSWLF